MDKKDRLIYWQQKMADAESAWASEREKMANREKLYMGDHSLKMLVAGDEKRETPHVWNIVAENLESIVDSEIPQPKVTPRRPQDEDLARKIEHMLANELDRMSMEEINDMMERTVPIQGGALFLAEWDNDQRESGRVGEVAVQPIHPKMLVPQPGIYRSIEDMDYVGLKMPQTREQIKRQYGVIVGEEYESDSDVKVGADEEAASSNKDMVTMCIMYYKNGDGIGKISWVNDTMVEDLEDYQARRLRRCKKCGQPEGKQAYRLDMATTDGSYPDGAEARKVQAGTCAFCGCSDWLEEDEDDMELLEPVQLRSGEIIGGQIGAMDEYGNVYQAGTARVPNYKPNTFPLILQKNVSVYGRLLGDSDVDKIEDQQNTINRMEAKIVDRLMKAGTRVSLPPDTRVTVDPKDGDIWRLENIEDRQYIGIYQFEGDLSSEFAYINQVYEESRRILGITDSFQGRHDSTATSGVAKQFSAAQAAGRMESKRIMKHAAYQRLFEMIFKLKLAYCDETRPITYMDKGEQEFETWNRYEFLERDETGELRWNTDFIFAVDDSSIGKNRAEMWNQMTAQLQSGAMGNPQELQTLIDYWAAMEELHYPMAANIKRKLMDRQQQAMQAEAAAAQEMNGQPAMQPNMQAAPAGMM